MYKLAQNFVTGNNTSILSNSHRIIVVFLQIFCVSSFQTYGCTKTEGISIIPMKLQIKRSNIIPSLEYASIDDGTKANTVQNVEGNKIL